MPRSTIPADTGNQAAISFASGITATLKVRRISQPGEQREKIECSDLSTEDYHKYIPADLAELPEIEIEFLWDTFDEPPAPGTDLGLVTITYPTRTGELTPATRAGSGYVSGVTPPTLANGELQVGSIRIQYDGVTLPAYTEAT